MIQFLPLVTQFWKPALIAAALATSFAAGWKVESWRTDAQVQRLMTRHAELQTAAATKAKDAEAAARAAEAKNRATEAALNQQIQDAQNAARTRETVLRRDADAARKSAVGLRDQLSAIRSELAAASSEARADAAVALSLVLEQCSERYRGLAETADRHASDVKTLSDAWPTAPAR